MEPELLLADAIHTVPTGVSSVPPEGPAIPETAIEISAPDIARAPAAIASTASLLTTP